ncbi:MAG: radical SAM protein [Deltaproteobacteria bacterium]|nr:radical SAM protein [Deltaproteobacteria bacterium]
MRVILINPPQPEEDLKSAFSKGTGFILPYNLLSLGTYLKQHGVEVDIVDCVAEGISLERIAEIVRTKGYDLAGVTGFTFSIPRAYKVAEVIKRDSPKTTVVLGGIHATVAHRQTLEECRSCDFVIAGEGEKVLLMLVKAIKKNKGFDEIPNLAYRDKNSMVKISTASPLSPVDVKELPIPDYSLLQMQLYVPHSGNYKILPTYSFYTSRGCPFSCSFCSANIVMGKKVRYKDIDKTFEELKVLVDDYGAKGLIIQDSTFTLNKKWVTEFCNRMIDEDLRLVWRANTRVDRIDQDLLRIMKKAGCHRVNVGFESGNQDTLDFLNKKTTIEQNLKAAKMVTDEGLELGASFIIGVPNEGMDHVLNTIKFAKSIGSKFTQFYLPVPYPGTKLRALCQDGLREGASWHDYSSRDFTNAVYINKNFDPEVFKKLPAFAFQRYYCNFQSVKRIIFSIKSIDELKDGIGILKNIFKKWRNPVSIETSR